MGGAVLVCNIYNKHNLLSSRTTYAKHFAGYNPGIHSIISYLVPTIINQYLELVCLHRCRHITNHYMVIIVLHPLPPEIIERDDDNIDSYHNNDGDNDDNQGRINDDEDNPTIQPFRQRTVRRDNRTRGAQAQQANRPQRVQPTRSRG